VSRAALPASRLVDEARKGLCDSTRRRRRDDAVMSVPAALIIDDDPDFRELMGMCLDGLEGEVLEAGDCVHGGRVLREARDRVVVILLDYWMPGMAPVPCVARIRELMRPWCRLVLVTAAVDAQARASEVGISEWLAKPFDNKLLREMVRASLERAPMV